jgi:methylenetetrahydrofolate dehydrogenase (NADP+) / methenyltetrahydrofolate cyclohydrolase
MILLDGKKLAQHKYIELAEKVAKFKLKNNRSPKLSVIIVGEDPASKVYVNNKKLACEQVGMLSEIIRLPEETDEAQLIKQIQLLNTDKTVDGFLVQLPLPSSLKKFDPTDYILPEKDVDGLCALNMGLMNLGKAFHEPCTPEGVMELLKHYKIPLEGKKAVVVGRSTTVGWPMAFMLTRAQCTVTVCHSRTKDITAWTKNADIVVVAAGKPHLFSASDFKKGAVVVDVGIHRNPSGKGLVGDVNFSSFKKDDILAITPVPGGVGPMTVAQLVTHTLEAAEKSENK